MQITNAASLLVVSRMELWSFGMRGRCTAVQRNKPPSLD